MAASNSAAGVRTPRVGTFAVSGTVILRPLMMRQVQAAIALTLLTVVAFAPLPACDFVNFDDPVYAASNPNVLEGLSPGGVVWAFTTTHASNWHPLTWLSLQLDADLYGPGPRGYHLTNLILHVLNVLLLYGLLLRLTGSWPPSALAAALFAVHPLHVESVAWVAERKDVLSTFFGLLAVAAYLGHVRRPSLRRGVLVCAAFAASLLAKPMLVTLPFLLLLLDFWPLRRAASWPRLLAEKWPLFVLAAAACAVTVWAQQRGGSIRTTGQYPPGLRLANAVDSTVAYLRQTVWPSDLAVFYPYPEAGLPLGRVAIEGALLLGLTVFVLLRARTQPYLLTGWLWYLGALVPVIGLVQVGRQARADRYTYVPLIGVFVALVWWLWEALPPRRRGLGLAIAALLLLPPCAVLTWRQAGYWSNSLTLWEHTLAVTSDNALARTGHGYALGAAGHREEAAAELEEAIRLRPDLGRALVLLGRIRAQQGRRREARACYRAAAASGPEYAVFAELADRLEDEQPRRPP